MGRSILAIVAGFVLIGVLAAGTTALLGSAMPGVFDANGRATSMTWELAMHAYVFAFATFGCWLAARLAPDHPMRHALILGVLGLVFNVVGSAVRWDTAPAWSHALGVALVMPAAWLGGWLAARRATGVTPQPAVT
jgi:hypothetical protein